jgi:uncharacterized protein YodC (DUF2158 family)
MEDIGIGSVVKLKSGGPQMTVKGYGKTIKMSSWGIATPTEDKGLVECQWFDSIGTLMEGTFPILSVRLDS